MPRECLVCPAGEGGALEVFGCGVLGLEVEIIVAGMLTCVYAPWLAVLVFLVVLRMRDRERAKDR